MKALDHQDKLLQSILILESKQANDAALFKDQLKITYDSLKPSKLIKNTLDDLISLPDFDDNIVDTSLGLVTGFISKKIAVGTSHSVFQKFLGSLIQIGVTNIVTNNADQIKDFAKEKINNFLAKRQERKS